jgi:hypothetical protein
MNVHSEPEKNPLYDDTLLQFVAACNAYCQWLEDLDISQPGDFLQEALAHLADIYPLAVRIELPDPMLEGGNEKFVTEQDWAAIFQKTRKVLGAHNNYLRVAANDEFDRSDLVSHTISEDLADMYQDLKDFTMQFRRGLEEIMNDAVWEVLSNFEQYWGIKLLNALGALHQLHVSKTELDASGPSAPGAGDEEDVPKYDTGFLKNFLDQSEDDDV